MPGSCLQHFSKVGQAKCVRPEGRPPVVKCFAGVGMWTRQGLAHISTPEMHLSIRQILARGWSSHGWGVWGEANVVTRARNDGGGLLAQRHAASRKGARALLITMGGTPPIPPSAACRRSEVDQRRSASLARCSAVAASRLSRALPILSTSRTSQRTSARNEDTSAIAVAAAPARAEPRPKAIDMIVSGDIA